MNKVSFFVTIKEYLFTLSRNKQYEEFEFPERIDEWEFCEQISKGRDFETAIYKHNEKQSFVKIWKGDKKDHRYYRLLNEYNLYMQLKSYSEQNQTLVTVPTVLLKEEDVNSLIIMVEYLSGESLVDKQLATQFKTYIDVIKFLEQATDFVKNNYKDVPFRNGKYDFLTFIPYLINILRWHPKKFFNMVALGFYYLINVKDKFNNGEYKLAHRDLHLENLILVNDKIYLIDLEYMSITTKYAEITNTLRLESSRNPDFSNKIKATLKLTKNKSLMLDLIATLFKWGVEDAFVDEDKKYTFLNFVNNIVKINIVRTIRSLLFKPFKFDNQNGVVICYHGIDGNSVYDVDLVDFQRQINELSEESKFLTLDQLLLGETGIAITFDDGEKSIIPGLEYLEERKIPYAIFIITDPNNVDGEFLGQKVDLLSDDEIKNLSRLPHCTIASHSARHTDLTLLDIIGLKKEIFESKQKLENLIGQEVKYFAYPRGKYNTRVVEVVKESGYKAGFSIEPGYYKNETKYTLPRTVINVTHGYGEINALISKPIQELKKQLVTRNIWKRINYEK